MRALAWAGATLALALLAGAARADRVPSFKVEVQPQHGTRPDIRVPYLTDGNSNLIVGQRVEPRVYSSPIVDDPANPQARPVYNLQFYGARMHFGGYENGAADRRYPYPLSR
jgi:hypothetical protein